MKIRCAWVGDDTLYTDYHDLEWGVPVFDDHLLFEFLILEGAQAGLSWITVLKKRENYRSAFEKFDPETVAEFSPSKIEELLKNQLIIRNRKKVVSAVKNARAFLAVQKEFGTFSRYIWNFVGRRPIVNSWKCAEEVPALTPESEKMSRDLRRRGFTFVGPTICYAFMQATGMVNDHTTDCFRYEEIKTMYIKEGNYA